MVGELSAPNPGSPWVGTPPGGRQGSSPHAWGMAGANKVLLDSLVAQRSDGAAVVGRGVPAPGCSDGQAITVANFPTTGGRHLGFTITAIGGSVADPDR